jgi:hypothetical protein
MVIAAVEVAMHRSRDHLRSTQIFTQSFSFFSTWACTLVAS